MKYRWAVAAMPNEGSEFNLNQDLGMLCDATPCVYIVIWEHRDDDPGDGSDTLAVHQAFGETPHDLETWSRDDNDVAMWDLWELIWQVDDKAQQAQNVAFDVAFDPNGAYMLRTGMVIVPDDLMKQEGLADLVK